VEPHIESDARKESKMNAHGSEFINESKRRGRFSPGLKSLRKPLAVRHFVVEPIERRIMLDSNILNMVINPGSSGPSAIIQAVSGTSGTVIVEAEEIGLSEQTPLSGNVSIEWWNGTALEGLTTTNVGGPPVATVPEANLTGTDGPDTEVTFTLNLADAIAAGGPTFTEGPGSAYPGTYYTLIAEFDGGSGYSPQWSTDGVLVQFTGAQRTLAFIQQPSAAAIGSTIAPPITVAVEDSTGATVTSSSDVVSLAVASGSGTLSGTSTVAAVNGIATFSGLSINAAGSYTLTATDDNTASAATPVTSSLFKITDTKLVFRDALVNADIDQPLGPAVIVEVVDAGGRVDTSASGPITISVDASSTGTGTLSGTLTRTAVHGVARFSNVSINNNGEYELDATDDEGDGGSSDSFGVEGVLRFDSPSYNAYASTPRKSPVIVEEVDYKGHLITTNSSSVVTLLPTGSLASTPIISNTAVMMAGKASFPNLTVPKVGEYVLRATDGSSDAAATAIFIVSYLNFRFSHPFIHADVNTPLAFKVEAVDDGGRLVTNATGEVSVALNQLPSSGTRFDHDGAALTGTTTVLLTGGEATFGVNLNDTITEPGNFTLTATNETDNGGVLTPDSTSVPAKSNPFTVRPDKLSITAEPSRVVNVNDPIPFQVKLESASGDIVNNASYSADVTAVETLEGGQIGTVYVSQPVSFDLASGTATFGNYAKYDSMQAYPYLLAPGKYRFTISVVYATDYLSEPTESIEDAVNSITTPIITAVAPTPGK
jgi:hypothetical protein